ncbi:DUF6157 family protein [uncultured Arcticibacterium sp.]|uniref:DUF6157 family protein n=1 Tax=uncultured Arcticibacterium sp. TaxID=2173042 RepID=UPI0030F69A1E
MIHSTNYYNTFIEIAEDCPTANSEIPPLKGKKKSLANLQFEMVFENPYKYTSDEVFYAIHVLRKEIPEGEREEQKKAFFSKGQPCFRASPLTKRYGWGLHSNKEGKIALYEKGSKEYQDFVNDDSVIKKKAMRSKRA